MSRSVRPFARRGVVLKTSLLVCAALMNLSGFRGLAQDSGYDSGCLAGTWDYDGTQAAGGPYFKGSSKHRALSFVLRYDAEHSRYLFWFSDPGRVPSSGPPDATPLAAICGTQESLAERFIELTAAGSGTYSWTLSCERIPPHAAWTIHARIRANDDGSLSYDDKWESATLNWSSDTGNARRAGPDIGFVRGSGKIDPRDFGNIFFKAAEGLSQYKASHEFDNCVRPGPLRKGPIPSESHGAVSEKLEDCNCQFFFRQVGSQLQQRGFDLSGSEWTDPKLQANDIASRIARSPNWQLVGPEEAQQYANRGALVEGVHTGDPNGHVATVSPVTDGFDVCKLDGSGPLVQDGNEHFVPAARAGGERQNFPSTWGVVRASKAMPLSASQWYVWLPSLK